MPTQSPQLSEVLKASQPVYAESDSTMTQQQATPCSFLAVSSIVPVSSPTRHSAIRAGRPAREDT